MFRLIVILSLYLSLVHADYTIDDSNYSVLTFSENPAGPVWGPFSSGSGEVLEIRLPNGTYQTVDATPCYDGTFTYAACNTSNNCAVQFSFTGSGITIYVLQAGPQGMSASLSIDSGTAQTITLGAPPPPQYYVPHAILFNVQNMPSGTHTAVMTVLDWNGGFSGMMLDYIDVNQAQVSDPTRSSPSPSPTPHSTSSQSPSSGPTSSSRKSQSSYQSATSLQANAVQPSDGAASVASLTSVVSFQASGSGATALPSDTASGNGTLTTSSPLSTPKETDVAMVAGGVVGGASLLALIGVAFLCIRRRRRHREQARDEATPHPLSPPPPEAIFTGSSAAIVNPFASSAALVVSPTQLSPGTAHSWDSWTDSQTISVSNAAVRDPRNPDPAADMSRLTRGTSSGNHSADSVDGSASPQSLRPAMPANHSYSNEKSRSGTISRSASTSSTLGQPLHQAHQSVYSATSTNAAQLTDEQADFVTTLFHSNVPGPVVAHVLERMLASPQAANANVGTNDSELRARLDPNNLLGSSQPLVWGNTAWTSTTNEMEPEAAPPSYDYVRAQQ